MMEPFAITTLRKAQVVGFLELMCQTLELSPSQFEDAKAKYEAVGTWLARSPDAALGQAQLYPQGSISLGTTVRPLRSDEYDVDLVCRVPAIEPSSQPSYLKRIIGDRLRAHGVYRDILEEKARCWRVVYANQFHLDITPSIPNPGCVQGGELVPDKGMKEWKNSNPKGYQAWFAERAALNATLRIEEAAHVKLRASLEALPQPSRLKGLLRRSVQLFKRHRDLWFSRRDADLAPISVVVTTLAAKSYAYCVTQAAFDSEFDVLLAVLDHMPRFIESATVTGKAQWFVWNETTAGENFAEKWNRDDRLARAFYDWHAAAKADFGKFTSQAGVDQLTEALSLSFGDVAYKALASVSENVNAARTRGALGAVLGSGVVIGGPATNRVRPNRFFGAR